MSQRPITSACAVDAAQLARVTAVVSGHGTLGHVLATAAAASPPAKPVALVRQDEYTHDVVMAFEPGLFVVYDVT